MKPAEYTAELSGELKKLDAKLAELRQSKAKALAELTQGGPRLPLPACCVREHTPSTTNPVLVAIRVFFPSRCCATLPFHP